MSSLSERLHDRAKRMEDGRHLGNVRVETIRAWADEVASLEAELAEARERAVPRVRELTDAQVIAARAAYRRSYRVLEYGQQNTRWQLDDLFQDTLDAIAAAEAATKAEGGKP